MDELPRMSGCVSEKNCAYSALKPKDSRCPWVPGPRPCDPCGVEHQQRSERDGNAHREVPGEGEG